MTLAGIALSLASLGWDWLRLSIFVLLGAIGLVAMRMVWARGWPTRLAAVVIVVFAAGYAASVGFIQRGIA